MIAVRKGSAAVTRVYKGASLAYEPAGGGGPVELVSNGTFDSNANGWTAVSGSIGAVAGWGRHTAGVAGTTYARTAISTAVGQTYRVQGEWRSSAANWRLIVGTSSGGNQLVDSGSAPSGILDTTFVASTTTTYVSVRNGSTPAVGDYAEIDNISVMRVDA